MSDLSPSPNHNSQRLARWLLPLAVWLGLTAITVIAWRWQVRVQVEAREFSGMQASAAITTEIRERLRLHTLFLRSLQAFAAVDPDHDLKQWRRFAQSIDISTNLAGLYAFAYAPAVAAKEKGRFMRTGGQPVESGHPRTFPPTGAAIAVPLAFVAPETEPLRAVIGFDQWSEPIRRQAIERAMARRDVTMSAPLVLLTDTTKQRPGFLLMHALYRPGQPLGNIQERYRAFAGVVMTAYRTDEFLAGLTHATDSRLALRIFDENPASDQSAAHTPTLIHDSAQNLRFTAEMPFFHHEIDFGGRNWILHFYPLDGSAANHGLDSPSLVLYGGLLGSALLGLLVFYLSTHRERAERYAEGVTQELREHRDHLHELVAERTARLDHALQQARAGSEAKSHFLANMSHELRTPMHAILSFSQLGGRRAENGAEPKIGQYFQRIELSAQRLLSLINQLLDLSKQEAGRMEITLQETDLRVLLEDARAQLESLLQPRRQRIEILGTTDSRIHGDPERLNQVIYNLLANAIKFSPEGGTITVELFASELPGGRRQDDSGSQAAIAMRFTDHGIGIPEAELESIFDHFVQSSATRTGAGGTGLGLAISRSIVTQHRGTIVANNNAGGGACFTVTLPVYSRPMARPESHD